MSANESGPLPSKAAPNIPTNSNSVCSDSIELTEVGTVIGGGNFMPGVPLTKAHWHELANLSGIHPDVIRERRYASVDRPRSADSDSIPYLSGATGDRREQLKAIDFPSWAVRDNGSYPMLWLPMYGPDGRKYPGQIKPWKPVRNREGKPMKYASAKQPVRLDVHPRWTKDRGQEDPALVPFIRDVTRPLWITEGIKKADALTSRDLCTVALSGVYNWRNGMGLLPDWEHIPLKGRTVYVCFDADALEKRPVLGAMRRLGTWLRYKGAKVLYVLPPAETNGQATKGVDDYFTAGGTVTELERRATRKCPDPIAEENRFTESHLAELVTDDVLADRFLNVANFGWMTWTGRVWKQVDYGAVVEAVRGYFRDCYRDALRLEADRADRGEMAGSSDVREWEKCQSRNRIANVAALAANMESVTATLDTFDTERDLLNTPSGVVDLRTGELSEHDPAQRFTKITRVDYVPDADAADLKAALEAVPADAREWLQVRLGQAMTGHEPDDDTMVLLTGGGQNGKTVLMGAVSRALGTYSRLVPNRLLLQGRESGSATPEKMTLQGVRLAYMEETPKGRYLDTNIVKEIVGNGLISGRRLFKDEVEFGTTHSLFLNTNNLPRVADTDTGTWRRLKRLDFPIRFRHEGQELETEHDRYGDPRLKARMHDNRENHEALLAWMVAGAQRWYAADKSLRAAVPEPAAVTAATQQWREQADPILCFLAEEMTTDPGRWVMTKELVGALRDWMTGTGHHPGAENTLTARLRTHSGLPEGVRFTRVRVLTTPGVSRRPAAGVSDGDSPPVGQTEACLGLRFRTPSELG